MSEKNDRPKPPARRAGGRALGGVKKTTPPPPPPAAELTPEQFAAEQAAAREEGRPAADESPAQHPSTAPAETSAQGDPTGTVREVPQPQVPPTVDIESSGAVHDLAAQPAHSIAGAPAVQPILSGQTAQGPEQFVVGAAEPAGPVVQSTQLTEQVPQAALYQDTATVSGVSPTAEVAVRPAASPVPGSTAFPVRTDVPGSHQERNTRSEAAPSEGTPWAQGPGRPKDIPETAVVLNQRIITRESLDSSVPAALRLKKRIKRFALDNELDHLPIGDIVSVALDEWLATRGF
ncbi:hypothetical protein ABZ848_33470 [Streptomyces sp. NPDC047081]|uniref:hypothetical protein n=1 Tax=Streptomyces sp. NPDC047081 TaxID=3154706 RepID=UPI0033D2F929